MTYNSVLEPSSDLDRLDNADGQISLVEMIETVISSLDSDASAMVSHTDSGYLWKFKYGTVEVFVQLTGTTSDDTFSAWAGVLQLPTKNDLQLMQKLMQMNWAETLEARFAILNGHIVVSSMRTVAEISPEEVSRIITLVASIADEQDEVLQAEFGAS